MRKPALLLILSCLGLLLVGGNPAAAQGFADMAGLERAVVRAWLGPETSTAGASTPTVGPGSPASTPMASADPATMTGTVFLSIGVFQFDSTESATNGFNSLAAYVTQISDGDPQFAGGSRIDPKLGDQSLSATANLVEGDVPFSFLLTVVRHGDLVFLLQGTLIRLDAPTEVTRLVTSLLAGTPGEGNGTYVAEGESTGGLWDVFAGVEPLLAPGSIVTDGTVKEA